MSRGERIGVPMIDEELVASLERCEQETQRFVRRVRVVLENDESVITPNRFSEIADQMERVAPNHNAFYHSYRLLGRRWNKQQDQRRSALLARRLKINTNDK